MNPKQGRSLVALMASLMVVACGTSKMSPGNDGAGNGGAGGDGTTGVSGATGSAGAAGKAFSCYGACTYTPATCGGVVCTPGQCNGSGTPTATSPAGTATAVQISATWSERQKAWRRSLAPATLAYHFSERPSGGKAMMLPAVKDAPRTTSVGAERMRSETATSVPIVHR